METGTMVEVVDQAVARSYIGDERILVQMRGWKKRDKGYNSMICGKSEEWLARNDKIVSLQCRRRNTRNQTLKRLRDELYGKKQKSSGGGGASSSDGGGGGGGGGDCDSDDPDSDDDDDDEGSDGTDDEDSDGDAYNDDQEPQDDSLDLSELASMKCFDLDMIRIETRQAAYDAEGLYQLSKAAEKKCEEAYDSLRFPKLCVVCQSLHASSWGLLVPLPCGHVVHKLCQSSESRRRRKNPVLVGCRLNFCGVCLSPEQQKVWLTPCCSHFVAHILLLILFDRILNLQLQWRRRTLPSRVQQKQ